MHQSTTKQSKQQQQQQQLQKQQSQLRSNVNDHERIEIVLLAEHRLLAMHCPAGIFVMPCERTALLWHGIAFVREGLWRHGVFRFTLHVPYCYPNAEHLPYVVIKPSLFHPRIHPHTGLISVTLPKRHDGSCCHIWEVLVQMKRLFYHVLEHKQSKKSMNSDALSLYKYEFEKFSQLASMDVSRSQREYQQNTCMNEGCKCALISSLRSSQEGHVVNKLYAYGRKIESYSALKTNSIRLSDYTPNRNRPFTD